MKLSLAFCGLLLIVATVSCGPVVKREAVDDLSPLNEVYVFQTDEDDRSDRDKRKIGIVKLGVSNGIINFVFGKLDAFLDAKTKALTALDEGNKVKNAAFEIDNTKSATSEFINKFIAQKLKATTGSVGPLLNAGTTFLTSAKQGLAGAFVSKFAPLSSLSGGLAGGLSGASGGGDDSSSGGGSGGSGSILTSLLGSLSSGSSSGGGLGSLSGGLSGGGGNGVDPEDYPSSSADANANAGFANLGVGYEYTPPNPQEYEYAPPNQQEYDYPPTNHQQQYDYPPSNHQQQYDYPPSNHQQQYDHAPPSQQQQYDHAPPSQQQQYDYAPPSQQQQYDYAPASQQQYDYTPPNPQQYYAYGR